MGEILDYVLKYYIGIILVAITGSISILFVQFNALKSGMRSILRNSIVTSYNKALDRSYIPIHERDNLQQLYCSYRDLKGNGNVKKLVEEAMNLPTREKA